MSKKRKHYMLDFDAHLWPEVWKVLAEKFDLTVTRRCHSIDGEEENVWMELNGVKSEDDESM